MKAAYFPILRRFFLFTALLAVIAGCGSGGSSSSNSATSATSSTSSTAKVDTGAIAVKVVWNISGSSSLAKTTEKVLYAAPAGVVKMRFTVSGTGMTDIVKEFVATPGVDGTGQIDGIPVGTGRKVTAQGLNSFGIVMYQGATLSNIDITVGVVTPVAKIAMDDVLPPVTTAAPGTNPLATTVTLTANEPATIYYTTNGNDPDNVPGNPSGSNQILDILITDTANPVKFFAIDLAGNRETTKTYTVPISSLSVSW